ncbi:MAG: hypothetical protein KDC75_10950, partial [Phaeodactylibacter sp.]|nr:hypothetical protein [Phaeodactylibacter sp.]
ALSGTKIEGKERPLYLDIDRYVYHIDVRLLALAIPIFRFTGCGSFGIVLLSFWKRKIKQLPIA